VAVELAKKIFGSLNARVYLVGAGNERTRARHLLRTRRSLFVARTYDRRFV